MYNVTIISRRLGVVIGRRPQSYGRLVVRENYATVVVRGVIVSMLAADTLKNKSSVWSINCSYEHFDLLWVLTEIMIKLDIRIVALVGRHSKPAAIIS